MLSASIINKCALLILTFSSVILTARAGEEELEALIIRVNSDVIELRNEVESSIANRCDSIRGCFKSSYDECQSAYTDLQTCPSEKEFGIVFSACGAGSRCNGLIDYAVSTVRIPENLARGPNKNPVNPALIEDVCMTLPTQRWMVGKYLQEKEFWSSVDVAQPQMYFGSDTGVFRIYPARQSEECGKYDPRTRPWYQAALPSTIRNAVKPRRVIIMLDTSRSMGEPLNSNSNHTKLSYMKQSVIAVLNSLSSNDSIAVIRFAELPRLVNRPSQLPPFLWEKASRATVDNMIESVRNLEVNGRSNWNDSFEFAFNLINNSLESAGATGDESYCALENIAVLFFSDGDYNLPAEATDDSVVSFVSAKVNETESKGDYHVHMFLYSLGLNDPNGVEKKISCAVDGYWKPVVQGTSPLNVTNGYQTLFSTPMGTNAFYNYTTWSNPYNFTSGGSGYTVSALVYDRNVEPPRFKGAVGMDVSVNAAIRLYNGTLLETQNAIKRITQNITAQNYNTTCDQQRINLTQCEIQSIRHYAGGNAAVCTPDKNQTLPPIPATLPTTNATTNVTAENSNGLVDFVTEAEATFFDNVLNCSKAFVQPCPGLDEYPTDLWRNVEMEGLTYQERTCCEVGTNEPSKDCPDLDEVSDTKMSKTAIFGILFGALLLIEILGCYFCFYLKKRRPNSEN